MKNILYYTDLGINNLEYAYFFCIWITNVSSDLIYPLVMESRRCVKFVVCKVHAIMSASRITVFSPSAPPGRLTVPRYQTAAVMRFPHNLRANLACARAFLHYRAAKAVTPRTTRYRPIKKKTTAIN